MLKSLTDSVLSVLYPRECTLCEAEVSSYDDGPACPDCWKATEFFTGNETLCYKCGAFLFAGKGFADASFCRRCDDQAYDRAFSGGVYSKALSASILQLKRRPHVPGRVRRLILDAFFRIPPSPTPWLLIPVPLSLRRHQERGFNQAELLGRIIARQTDLDLDSQTLVRRIHTPMHRAGMDRKARATTVRKAFDVTRPKFLTARDVLLVDDVFTSGETVSSCAEILKESGAATVNVLTIAHAA